FLEEGADGSMALKRLVAGKQQTSIDVFGDQIVIGSASPDNELRANELQLYRDTDFVNLPANRGVSAVKFMQLDSDPEPEIIAADGLPNDQTKRGRPQLAVFDFVPDKDDYVRHAVDTISSTQGIIDRFDLVNLGAEPALLARGTQLITLYRPARNW